MKIIYQQDSGIVAIIHPTGELPIEEVARKDVPAGVPYLIIEEDVIPSDRTFRDAWEADFSAPHGYGIGAKAWFLEQYAAEVAAIKAEVEPVAPKQFVPGTEEEFAELVLLSGQDRTYAEYVAHLEELNVMINAQHAERVQEWKDDVACRLEILNDAIADMEKQP